MEREHGITQLLISILKYLLIFILSVAVACAASLRMLDITGVRNLPQLWSKLENRLSEVEQDVSAISLNPTTDMVETGSNNPLYGKKIVYDGDSIAASRDSNGGGYAALIAELRQCTSANFAKGGARLCSNSETHSVVDNLVNLPADGDLYCFEGGINDFWANTPVGKCVPDDYNGQLDTGTICGAMETIFRYCIENFPGKPICFVIVHKIQNTATSKNANGVTFADYRSSMISVCEKYSIPYYDAFAESGLNGWSEIQSDLYLTGNSEKCGDGIHPNVEGYQRYYVPQLLDLFDKIMPVA